MKRSLRTFFGVLALSTIVLSIFLVRTFIVQAEIYAFYPTTCLGGWYNTDLATDAPSVVPWGEEAGFNETNSAVLDSNSQSQIFCGGFGGGIQENTVPRKIKVKMAIAFAYRPVEAEPDIVDSTVIDTSTETAAQEVLGETIKESSTSENQGVEAVVLPQTLNSQEEITTETISEPTQELTPDIIADETTQEATPELEPEPENEAPQEESETVSFFRLFNLARAEEVLQNDGTSSTEETLIEDTVVTPSGETAIVIDDVIESENVSTTTEEVISTSTEEVITEEISPYAAEVLYTLDGTTWETLGFVEEYSEDNIFEIPIEDASSWEDISKIQIGIQRATTLDGVQPVIFLDSVWLEIEYEFIEEAIELTVSEEETNEEVLGVIVEETPPPPLPFTVRKFDKEIVIDSSVPHRCDVRPFSVDMSKTTSTSTQLFLEKQPGMAYVVEIGSLPDDITVHFANNDGYIYAPGEKETILNLLIAKGEYARQGNFNVPIYLTRKGEVDSSTLCQFNIVNE